MDDFFTLRSDNLGVSSYVLTDKLMRTKDDKSDAIAIGEITQIRLMTVGSMGLMEVRGGGSAIIVSSDREPTEDGAQSFRAFVEELHRRTLAAGQPVEYVGGHQIAPAVGAIAGAALLALAFANPWGWDGVRSAIAYVIGASSLVGGILLTIKNRRRFYDPMAIPQHLLPDGRARRR